MCTHTRCWWTVFSTHMRQTLQIWIWYLNSRTESKLSSIVLFVFTSVHYLHWGPLSSLMSIIFTGVHYPQLLTLSSLVSIFLAGVRYLRLCPLSLLVSVIFICVHYLHLCPLSSLVSIIFACVQYPRWYQFSSLVSSTVYFIGFFKSMQIAVPYRLVSVYQSFEAPCRFPLQVWVRLRRKWEVNTKLF